MAKREDLTGQVFGRLTVVEFSHVKAGRYMMWLCRCECGVFKDVPSYSLVRGTTRSCGCLRPRGAQRIKKEMAIALQE
jgi:hypothetical protein